MAFSEESFARAKDIINGRRARAVAEADARQREIYLKIPAVKQIDADFSKIGQKIIEAVMLGKPKEETDALIAEIRAESDALTRKRAEALSMFGYPEDFTSPKYTCTVCEDTGYSGLNMCACLRRELTRIGYESSGLGALLAKQSFDNFTLDYYTGEERLIMEQNFNICRSYAEDFGKSSPSMIFMGKTGLGKTHLSTSIAAAVIDKGYDVIYETSQNLISVFSAEQFGRLPPESTAKSSSRYLNCDLLIIDDFGTEMVTQFTVSCFYNLINTRINRGLPIIINTNLGREEMQTKYTDRIVSRLFGEFMVLAFMGRDIRMQKLMDGE